MTSIYPGDRHYTNDHEWIEVSGNTARVGITDYAQQQLGDVVFVELPPVGQSFEQGAQFGSIESVKAVSDLYCPMGGRVVDVNTELIEHPEIVNSDPHATWMLVLELAVPEQISELLDAAAYSALVA
ncbi:MAG: glycine cleavage system protein GcvH [Acidobacteriota bacterium]|nr:glycine cleavage system protein GcvH [Acidobacteriota bacterium]